MKATKAPTIDELALADEPGAWAALGFAVHGRCCQIGGVRLRFADSPPAPHAPGIVGWSLRDLGGAELDGLPTTRSRRPPAPLAATHPNGVLAIDHIVA